MRRVLITGGRAPVSLELARIFKKSGYEVYGADSTYSSFLLASNAVKKNFVIPSPRFQLEKFQQALLDIINHHGIDLLVPTCEEIFYIAKVKHRLPAHCTIIADDLAILNDLHNKWTFIQMAEKYGLAVPQTRLLQAASSRVNQTEFTFPVVIKPIYSRFGDKVVIVDSHEELEDLKRRGRYAESPMIMQQYLRGNQICTYTIARHGKILAHTAYPTKYKWGRGSSIYFEHIDHEQAFEWVQAFVSKTRFNGQIAFDFIDQANGTLSALECNPRATSGVHLLRDVEGISDCFDFGTRPENEPQRLQTSMIALAMLFFAMRSIRTKQDYIAWRDDFCRGRDVIWSLGDPMPTLMQGASFMWFLILSVAYGISMTSATTVDIEYSG